MNCGQTVVPTTATPTYPPTMSPSVSPSSAPSHSQAFTSPTLAPSTQALRDFLSGTTASPATEVTDEGTTSVNSLNTQTSGIGNLWSLSASVAVFVPAVIGTLSILCY